MVFRRKINASKFEMKMKTDAFTKLQFRPRIISYIFISTVSQYNKCLTKTKVRRK